MPAAELMVSSSLTGSVIKFVLYESIHMFENDDMQVYISISKTFKRYNWNISKQPRVSAGIPKKYFMKYARLNEIQIYFSDALQTTSYICIIILTTSCVC